MTTIPDECIGRAIEVVQEVTLASFKRVRRYDRHPRRLGWTDRLDLAEDVLTCLDFAARRWLGTGCEGITDDDSNTSAGGGSVGPARLATH